MRTNASNTPLPTRNALVRSPLMLALALLAVVIGGGVWGARYIASRVAGFERILGGTK